MVISCSFLRVLTTLSGHRDRSIARAESRLHRQALFQTGAGLSKPNANEMGAQTGEMTESFGTVDSTV